MCFNLLSSQLLIVRLPKNTRPVMIKKFSSLNLLREGVLKSRDQRTSYLFLCKYRFYLLMILGDRMVLYKKDVFPTAIGTFMQSVEGTGSPTAVLFIAVQRSHCVLLFNRILRTVRVISSSCRPVPDITTTGPIAYFSFPWPTG